MGPPSRFRFRARFRCFVSRYYGGQEKRGVFGGTL